MPEHQLRCDDIRFDAKQIGIETDIGVAKVITENQDDVGPLCRGGCLAAGLLRGQAKASE